MHDELAAEGLALEVHILGVNPAGLEAGNAQMCDGRDLPWLQETGGGASVWDAWEVEYRDVVVVGAGNVRAAAYNLTTHDLAGSVSYEALKSLLRDAATP